MPHTSSRGGSQIPRQQELLPELLLADVDLLPLDKLLYVLIASIGPTTIKELSRRLTAPLSTVSTACNRLSRQGWLYKVRSGHNVSPVITVPFAVQEQMIADYHVRLAAARYKGEFMMRTWADLLIPSDAFVDGARPAFLKRPDTGEPLELDRFYPGLKLGLEYHGPQHFGPTHSYPSIKDFNERRMRDCLKRSLCEDAGVKLVVFVAQDLTLGRAHELLSKHAVVRQIDPKGPYCRVLEQDCIRYASLLEQAVGQDQSH